MEVSRKVAVIVACVCVGAGALIGSKCGTVPPQSVARTVTKDRVVTQTKEVVRPDGTVQRDVVRTEDRSADSHVAVAPAAKKDWIIGVGYGIAVLPYYGVSLHRRVLGDFYLGVSGDTRGEVIASLLFTF